MPEVLTRSGMTPISEGPRGPFPRTLASVLQQHPRFANNQKGKGGTTSSVDGDKWEVHAPMYVCGYVVICAVCDVCFFP